MQIIKLELNHEYLYCPVTGQLIQDPEMGYGDIVESVRGYWIGEVADEPEIKDNDLRKTWEAYCDSMKGKYKDVTSFLESYDAPNWIVFELTSHGMACGPISSIIWYVIDMDTPYEEDKDPYDGYRWYTTLEDDDYAVWNVDGTSLLTHMDKSYPHLPDGIANILCNDLNNLNKHESSELRHSFVYCVLNTIIERKRNDEEFNHEIDISEAIQYDRVYRLNPGPPMLLLELQVVEPLKKFLGDRYVDLPLKYAQSIDEMKENEVPFVPNDIMKAFQELLSEFNEAENFAVELLFNYFNSFSITLPILWVAGKLTSKELAIADLRLEHYSDSEVLTDKEQSMVKDLVFKLDNLMKLLRELRQSSLHLTF